MREPDTLDRKIDESLGALGGAVSDAPPLGTELERELAALGPVETRAPHRQLAGVLGLSLLAATGITALAGLRRDLGAMPTWHLAAFAALWLASFAAISWLVLVPPPRQVMPRWRAAASVAVASALLLIGGGLLLPRAAPGLSTVYDPTVASVIDHAGCVLWGLAGAALPILLAALAVRGSVPVGTPWMAAAVGAAGGALGGLVLQFHCPITERFHVGLVHGGLVVLAALVAAALSQARAGIRARTPQG